MCHFLPIPVDMFSVNTTYRSSIPLDLGLQQQLWGPKRGALANPCADGEEVDWGAASSSAPLMFKRMIGNSANRFIYLYFFIFLTTYMFIYIYMPTVVSQFCFEEMDLLPELRLKNVLGRLEHQWTKWPSQPAGVGSFTWILLLYYFLCAYMTPLCHLCHILVPFPLLMSYCFPSIKMSQTLSISFNFQLLSPTIYSPLYI